MMCTCGNHALLGSLLVGTRIIIFSSQPSDLDEFHPLLRGVSCVGSGELSGNISQYKSCLRFGVSLAGQLQVPGRNMQFAAKSIHAGSFDTYSVPQDHRPRAACSAGGDRCGGIVGAHTPGGKLPIDILAHSLWL